MSKKTATQPATTVPFFARKIQEGTRVFATGVRAGVAESGAKLREEQHKD